MINRVCINKKKGFSLVELIVIIAIMAIIIMVLAPSLLQYVDRSRTQKDDSMMGEVVNVIKLAMTDQDVFDEVLNYTLKNNANHYNIAANETAGTLQKLDDDRKTPNETGMRGVTITFLTTGGRNNARYIIANAVVNKARKNDAAANEYFNGVKPAATKLKDMSANDDGSAIDADATQKGRLYASIVSGVGTEIKLNSQTYRNSDFTVFIDMGIAAGSAVKVYGEWEGANLSAVSNEIAEDPANCDHNHIDSITTPATCTTTGIKTYACLCGDSYTEEVPALGHNYIVMETLPSCTEQGCVKYTCLRCGESYIDSYIDANQHAYVSTSENGYTTYRCENCPSVYGTVRITVDNREDFGYDETIVNWHLVIPETIMKKDADGNNIIYTVVAIEDGVFTDCPSLVSVTIPSGVTEIGGKAFDNCESLTNIKVDPDNESYCDVDGVLLTKDKTTLIRYPAGKTDAVYNVPDGVKNINDYTFFRCQYLENVTLPNGLESVGSYAFAFCDALENVEIPNTVTAIDSMAFYNCQSFTNIVVPDSVTILGPHAFRNCTSLETITLSNNITIIDNYAFYGCASLESVIIPEGVETIDYYAFENCTSLRDITIPVSVTNIGRNALRSCTSLADIYFSGTKAQWDDIDKGNYWNQYTGNYTIHCSDGDI